MIELQITGVICGILFLAAYFFVGAAARRPVRCLATMAVAKTSEPCPVSGADYRSRARHGVAPIRKCTFRATLSSRASTSARRFRRRPPGVTGRLVDEGGALVLEVTPRFWWRWIAAPLLQLVTLLYLVMSVVHLVAWIRGRREGEPVPRSPLTFICCVGAIFLTAWGFWSAFCSGWGRERTEIATASVTHRVLAAGFALHSRTFSAPMAFCPVGDEVAIAHDQGADVVATVADNSRGVIATMNDALRNR